MSPLEKKYTYAIYTNVYLEIAEELGLEVETFSEHSALARVFTKDKELFIKICHLSMNSAIGISASANKKLTYSCLKAADLPFPLYRQFSKEEIFSGQKNRTNIYEFAENRYPVVAKPSKGFGGKGVYPFLRNQCELDKALDLLEQCDRDVIVEEHIQGRHFRFTVVENETIDITERLPAHVVGDGSHTIKELVALKNVERRPYGISYITKRNCTANQVSDEIVDWSIKPLEGEVISLSLLCNLSTGGDVIAIDNDVHPEYLELAVKAAQAVDLNFAGVDIISTDISVGLDKSHAVINEVNSHPAPDVAYPTMDYQRAKEMPKKLLSKFFNIKN